MGARNFILSGATISALLTLTINAAAQEITQEPLTPITQDTLSPAGDSAPSENESAPNDQAVTQPQAIDGPTDEPIETPINEDEMAASLNARQQFQQSYTFTRTINGKVVEREKRSVTIAPGAEKNARANANTLEALRTRFDSELLTRTEAFEEAKLDFASADKNGDNLMSVDEFTALAQMWRESETRKVAPITKAQQEEQVLKDLLAEIAPEEIRKETQANARQKFAFMAGAAPTLSSKDYIAEYLLDFDTMDGDGDTLLKGSELVNFRAVTRGEQPATSEGDDAAPKQGIEQAPLPILQQAPTP